MSELRVTDEMVAAGVAAVNAHLNREGDYDGAMRVGIEAALASRSYTTIAGSSRKAAGNLMASENPMPPEVIEAAAQAIRSSHPRDVEYSVQHYLPEAEAAIRAADEKRGIRVERQERGGFVSSRRTGEMSWTKERYISDWEVADV